MGSPDSTQLKGADGTCETVIVKGVRINKHEYNEKEHGPVDEPRKKSSGGGVSKKAGTGGEADYDSMTVEELKSELDRQGIEYTSEDRKDDLVKKLKKGVK